MESSNSVNVQASTLYENLKDIIRRQDSILSKGSNQ